MDIDVGQLIAGKYELQKLLGKGAMGEVWLATHNSLGGEFAIKLVETTDDIEAETAAGRFQLEAQIAAKLSRKTRHIVSVSDHGEEDGLAYLVMELLEGESLEAKVKRVGRLDLAETAAIVMQVARALSLAHDDGIFHRDLKPANVFLTKDEDNKLIVKLLDFGIARTKKPFRTKSPFATSKDMVLGTPSYMSPEQARGLDTLDYRCDLWALAVVAYEALTERIPFEGETVEDIFLSICTFRVVPVHARRPDLPPEIEAFFARAFAPKLEARFSSANELTTAFEQLVAPEALEAAIGGPIGRISERNLRAVTPSQPQIVVPTPSQPMVPDSNPHLSADPIPVWGEAGLPPKRRGGGIIFAIAGGAAVVAILVFALVAFRGSAQSKTTSSLPPPPDTAAPSPPASAAPAPTEVTPSPTIAEAPTNAAPANPVTAKNAPAPKTGPKAATTAAAAAKVSPGTTTQPASTPVTTAGTVAPVTPPPPTPRDKSGVF